MASSVSGEYWLFSEDLERSLVEPPPYTPLSEWTSERTPYLRDEAKCRVLPPLAPGSECLVPLVTDKGPLADVAEDVRFGGPLGNTEMGPVNAVGATPDFSHVILSTTAAELLPGTGDDGLYEWSAGKLAGLSLTPQGMPCVGNPMLGAAGGVSSLGLNWRNALSPDGGLVVFSDRNGAGVCSGHLYLRDVATAKTV